VLRYPVSEAIEGDGVRALAEALLSVSQDISKRLTFSTVQVQDDNRKLVFGWYYALRQR